MTKLRPVILAAKGGLPPHPLSSAKHPSQFRHLLEGDSPFQDCLERISDEEFLPPLILGSQGLCEIIQQQCDEISFDVEDILCEGDVYLSPARWAQERGEEDIPLLILPSNHFISDQTAFMRATVEAGGTACHGYIVSFGVIAERADPTYDYIQVGQRLDTSYRGHSILKNVENPSYEAAQNLLQQGGCVWDSGIFCATPTTLLQSKNKQSTAVVSLLSPWADLGTWPGLWKALNLTKT